MESIDKKQNSLLSNLKVYKKRRHEQIKPKNILDHDSFSPNKIKPLNSFIDKKHISKSKNNVKIRKKKIDKTSFKTNCNRRIDEQLKPVEASIQVKEKVSTVKEQETKRKMNEGGNFNSPKLQPKIIPKPANCSSPRSKRAEALLTKSLEKSNSLNLVQRENDKNKLISKMRKILKNSDSTPNNLKETNQLDFKIQNGSISTPMPNSTNTSSLLQSYRNIQTPKLTDFDKFSNTKLLLPAKFELLKKKFDAMESAMSIYFGRNKTYVAFDDAKRSIERQIHKEFTQNDLSHILSIFPEAYRLEQFLERDTRGGQRSEQKLGIILTQKTSNTNSISMPHNEIKQRQQTFSQRLLRIVYEYHQKWCEEFCTKTIDPFSHNVQHRLFPLEQTPLPKPFPIPIPDKTLTNKNDLMMGRHRSKSTLAKPSHSVASNLLSESLKLKLSGLVDEKSEGVSSDIKSAVNQARSSNINDRIRSISSPPPTSRKTHEDNGLSLTLLEKIRNKSRCNRVIEEDRKSNTRLKNLNSLKSLSELIRVWFMSKHKSRASYDELVNEILHAKQMKNSIKVDEKNILFQIDLLVELCAKEDKSKVQLKKVQFNDLSFVQINFNVNLNFVHCLIEKEVEKCFN